MSFDISLIADWATKYKDVFLLLGGAFGLYKWSAEQEWQKMKYIAEQVKAFDSDKSVIRAKQMLDWEASKLKFECGEHAISRKKIAHALRIYGGDDLFEDYEVEIRGDFDAFFDHLNRFQAFVELGLIEAEKLDPFLGYWLEILSTDRSNSDEPNELITTIQEYVTCYGYERASKLISDTHDRMLREKEIEKVKQIPDVKK